MTNHAIVFVQQNSILFLFVIHLDKDYQVNINLDCMALLKIPTEDRDTQDVAKLFKIPCQI